MNYRKGKKVKSRCWISIRSEFKVAIALNRAGDVWNAFADISAGGGAAFKFVSHKFVWQHIETFFQEKVDRKRASIKMSKGMDEDELFFVSKGTLGIGLVF